MLCDEAEIREVSLFEFVLGKVENLGYVHHLADGEIADYDLLVGPSVTGMGSIKFLWCNLPSLKVSDRYQKGEAAKPTTLPGVRRDAISVIGEQGVYPLQSPKGPTLWLTKDLSNHCRKKFSCFSTKQY